MDALFLKPLPPSTAFLLRWSREGWPLLLSFPSRYSSHHLVLVFLSQPVEVISPSLSSGDPERSLLASVQFSLRNRSMTQRNFSLGSWKTSVFPFLLLKEAVYLGPTFFFQKKIRGLVAYLSPSSLQYLYFPSPPLGESFHDDR